MLPERKTVKKWINKSVTKFSLFKHWDTMADGMKWERERAQTNQNTH